jgi:hypothetical protein
MLKRYLTHPIIYRIFILFTSSIAILGMASSCGLPGGSSTNQTTFGILKRMQSEKSDGFLRANAVRDLDGNLNNQGLTPYSAVKLLRHSKSELFLLTREKGLFKTVDGGIEWSRLYVFPIFNTDGTSTPDNEVRRRLQENDKLIINDVAVNPDNPEIIFVAGKYNNLGKVYRSLDGGDSFQELYTEVQDRVGVIFITLDPQRPLQVYAVLERGALIKSLDGGITWQRVRVFRDIPIQIGFIPEFSNILYILFERVGLATSTDGGQSFETKALIKSQTDLEQRQPEDKLDKNSERATFAKYEKIVPDLTSQQPSWVLIADGQMWYSQDQEEGFTRLVLPSQAEQINIQDIAVDPQSGLDRIIASVDDKLFITRDRGTNWTAQDLIRLSSPIGNIAQILIEPEDTEIIYLALVDRSAKRNSGLIGF